MSAASCALEWRYRGGILRIGERPLIMGIINVTPDSFSDGGRYADPQKAVARGLALAEEGADILDIGGESTRPGAAPVTRDEELRRILPVVEGLAGRTPAVLSIDTRRAEVAARALEAGAGIVNDVSALGDPRMAPLLRESGAGAVLMHMRGEPGTMQNDPRYADVVGEVRDFLAERLRAAVAAGIAPEALAIDPGIGFGKTVEHNLRLLAGLPALAALRRPVAVGVSRKRFIGAITGREVDERLAGSLAALVCSVLRGALIVRVHDVKASRDAVLMAAALQKESG